jgi:hypothetical protein
MMRLLGDQRGLIVSDVAEGDPGRRGELDVADHPRVRLVQPRRGPSAIGVMKDELVREPGDDRL